MTDKSYVITTVIVPPASTGLTTLDTVKDELSIADTNADARLARWIRQASSAISNYCNRDFALATYQDLVRPGLAGPAGMLPGRYAPLKLARWPLVGIVSIVEQRSSAADPIALTADVDFETDPATAEVYRLDHRGNPRDWSATKLIAQYRAGYSLPGDGGEYSLPGDIEDACIRLVTKAWFARGRDPLLKSENVPDVGEAVYWISNGSDGNFPPDIADLLDNYRTPVIS